MGASTTTSSLEHETLTVHGVHSSTDGSELSVISGSSQGSAAEHERVHEHEPMRLYTARNLGFLAQYFVVGLIYGGLPATMYGVLSVYLNTPGYIYDAAGAMATLPWSFKALYGAVHDCMPILGYRRKPYARTSRPFALLLPVWALPVGTSRGGGGGMLLTRVACTAAVCC